MESHLTRQFAKLISVFLFGLPMVSAVATADQAKWVLTPSGQYASEADPRPLRRRTDLWEADSKVPHAAPAGCASKKRSIYSPW
jgi:hypothetical protein